MGLPPAGDFTLAAQVQVQFGSMYDAGALLLHARERHWAKVCLEYFAAAAADRGHGRDPRGVSDDCNSFEVDGDTLWLRITRTGAAWAFHASADGSWWRLLRYFALGGDPAELVRVGFMAQSPPARAAPPPSTTSLPARRPEEPARRQLTASRQHRAAVSPSG